MGSKLCQTGELDESSSSSGISSAGNIVPHTLSSHKTIYKYCHWLPYASRKTYNSYLYSHSTSSNQIDSNSRFRNINDPKWTLEDCDDWLFFHGSFEKIKKTTDKKVQTKQTNAPKYPLIAYLHNLHFLCLCEIDTSGQCIIGRAHQLAAPRLDTETWQSWHHGPYPKKKVT